MLNDPATSGSLTDAELCNELVKRYTGDAIPLCVVCGSQLSLAASGGGMPDEWGCTGYEPDPEQPDKIRMKPGRRVADEHFSRSYYTDRKRGGDALVLELVRRYQEGKAR